MSNRHLGLLGLTALIATGALERSASAQTPKLFNDFSSSVTPIGDQTGYSVAVLDDVNGDGSDDMVVGAPYDDSNGADSGTVYVVNGDPQDVLYAKFGGAAGNHFGWSVASLGDVDGDGVDDFVVGSPGSDAAGTDAGSITVYSGKTGLIVYPKLGPKAGSNFGYAVAGGGDINGDGRGDFVVGAPAWDASGSTQNQGWIGVYSGLAGNSITTLAGDTLTEKLGSSVAIVGDIDEDGYADYAAGSPGYDFTDGPFSFTDAGRVRAWSGFDHSQLWKARGADHGLMGTSLCNAGDTDGNGQLEVLVGEPGAAGGGIVLRYHGKLGILSNHYVSSGLTSTDGFGTTVAALGDVNHDGFDDVAIGAPLDVFTLGIGGYVNLYSGDSVFAWGTLASPTGGDSLGSALSASVGDLDGDDWNDLLTGWPLSDPVGTNCGAARAYSLTWEQPDLGFKGPGFSSLDMYGTQLESGGIADMALTNSQPSSPAFLVASAVELEAPFKGGTLVPSPAFGIFVPFVTDAQGKVKLTDIPGGGGPLTVFMQFLIQDAAQPKGWQISNAVEADFLP